MSQDQNQSYSPNQIQAHPHNQNILLDIKAVSKFYSHNKARIVALKEMNLSVYSGEIIGIVGESGSGKSTLAKLVAQLEMPSKGSLEWMNQDISAYRGKELKQYYKQVQMVFQDPKASFNPKRTIGASIQEHYQTLMGKEKKLDLDLLLGRVGLEGTFAKRYPDELSGGQCQRAALARAISTEPKLLICDEATSALDVTVQAQIATLIEKIKTQMNMAVIMISHDLGLVSTLCDRTCVLYNGEIMELGSTYELIHRPKTAYTKALLSAIMTI